MSKNRKKGWRKKCSVQEIDEFLEDKRHDERTGGDVTEKDDANLFFIQKSTINDDKDIQDETENSSYKKLRCFEILNSYSKVPVPIKITQSNKSGKITKKPYKKQGKKHFRSVQKKSNKTSEVQPYDIWAEKKLDDEQTLIGADLDFYIKETTRKRTPKVPLHRFQKPSLLPSVEIPHPGASYNPTFEDHQNLLSHAHNKEVENAKKESKLANAVTRFYVPTEKKPNELSWLKEMTEGLNDDESEESEPEVELKKVTTMPKDRRLKAKRRRERENLKKIREEKLKRLSKRRENEVYRIKSIKKEIKVVEDKAVETEKKTAERKIARMYEPHQLGSTKYDPPEIEIKLSDELTDSYRKLKPEGSLLEDRYKSFQRRNLLEARTKQKLKRKYKLKVYHKKGGKD